jgi:hypothetical protein
LAVNRRATLSRKAASSSARSCEADFFFLDLSIWKSLTLAVRLNPDDPTLEREYSEGGPAEDNAGEAMRLNGVIGTGMFKGEVILETR